VAIFEVATPPDQLLPGDWVFGIRFYYSCGSHLPVRSTGQQAGLRFYYIEGVLVVIGTVLYTVRYAAILLLNDANCTSMSRLILLNRGGWACLTDGGLLTNSFTSSLLPLLLFISTGFFRPTHGIMRILGVPVDSVVS